MDRPVPGRATRAPLAARSPRATGFASGALAFVALVACPPPATAQLGAPPAAPYAGLPSVEPVSPGEAARWREDLDQLARELVERHANAFHTVEPEAFRASVAALRARIPGLARHEIIVEAMRIAAAIGDGHTSVPVLFDPAAGFHALPLRLGWYEEGLFVEAVARQHGVLAGGRVVEIGGVPTEEAMALVAPLIARDNEIWLRTMAPLFLAVTEILHAVGLSDDPMAAELTVERDGRPVTLRVAARSEPFVLRHGTGGPSEGGWIDARDTSPGASPLWRRNPGRPYWLEHLPERGALYIQYDQVMDAPHGPDVRAFFEDALRLADERGVRRVILDIRDNSGGEGMLNLPVVKAMVRRPRIDRAGGLFVIIGRRTFSAAQMLAHQLDVWTEAIFVGEPTGSSPRFYGDHSFVRLEHSGVLVSAAPTWWQPGGPYDRRPFLPPTLAFEPRWEDYVGNRDPALEAVLGWDDRVTLGDLVLGALTASAAGEAARRVRRWSADPVHRYASATSELNRLGYRLLREGRTDDALAVFRLNVEVHPEYANGWDSLGEALLSVGRREEGLAAYRRAYELDPGVGRAAEVLERETP